VKNEWGGELVPWSSHPALRGQWGEANRMRAVVRGEQIRLYFNGVLAVSVRDRRFNSGRLRLVVAPGTPSAAVVAFSDLQVREVAGR
jgi:hypothetical protein